MDQRLVWRQLSTAQPNVSGLLAQSNKAFNNAADAAGSILGKYQEGQLAAADQEVAQEIAGLNSEEELDQWLAGGGLNGRRVSQGMLNTLLGTRGNTLGYANDRSITRDRDGRLGIAQAANGRAQTTFDRGIAREDELNNLSSLIVGARTEGQDAGTAGNRNSAFENYLSSTIQSESGGDPNARNPRSSATGLGQFTDGTWREMMARHPDLGLTADGRTDPAQAERALRRFTEDNMRFLRSAGIEVNEGTLYQAHFLGAGGARAVAEAGPNARMVDIMPSNVIEANPFLRNMTKSDFEAWAYRKGTANAPSRTPNRDALESALAGSRNLSPQDVTALLNTNDGFVSQGDQRLNAERLQAQEDIVAALTQQAINDPNNVTQADVDRAVREAALATGEFSDSEATRAGVAATSIIEGSQGAQAQLSPAVAEDVRFSNLIEGTNQDIQAALSATPQGRMMGYIEEFAEDPVGSLESSLGLGENDDQNPYFGRDSNYSSENLRRLVAKYADDNNVTEEVAAAAMREAFEDDPFGRNTLENRFPATRVAELIKGNLGQEDVSRFRDDSRRRGEIDQQLRTMNDRVIELQRQAQRFPERRGEIQIEIAQIYQQMAGIRDQAGSLYRGREEN